MERITERVQEVDCEPESRRKPCVFQEGNQGYGFKRDGS